MQRQTVFYRTPDGQIVPVDNASPLIASNMINLPVNSSGLHHHYQQQPQPQQPPPQQGNRPAPMSTWKRQLAEQGFASCVHTDCLLSFLSIAGMVAHHKTCMGMARSGDYVVCNLCGTRFKQFKSMQTHREKAHYHVVQTADSKQFVKELRPETLQVASQNQPPSRPPVRYTYQRNPPAAAAPLAAVSDPNQAASEVVSENDRRYLSQDVIMQIDNVPSQSSESQADQAARLMAESRMISTSKRRGRPSKHSSNVTINKDNLQYQDPFDILQENNQINQQHQMIPPPPPAQAPPPQPQQQQMTFQVPQEALREVIPSPMSSASSEHHVAADSSTATSSHSYLLVSSPGNTTASYSQMISGTTVSLLPESPAASSSHSQASHRTTSSAASRLVIQPAPHQISRIQATPLVNYETKHTPSEETSSLSSVSIECATNSAASVNSSNLGTVPQRMATAKVEQDDELSEREKALAEQEAKLADYERLVLQSEKMAADARKARLEERERQLKKRQEELQKRLAEAVQTLEEVKPGREEDEESVVESEEQVPSVDTGATAQSEFEVSSNMPADTTPEERNKALLTVRVEEDAEETEEELVEADNVESFDDYEDDMDEEDGDAPMDLAATAKKEDVPLVAEREVKQQQREEAQAVPEVKDVSEAPCSETEITSSVVPVLQSPEPKDAVTEIEDETDSVTKDETVETGPVLEAESLLEAPEEQLSERPEAKETMQENETASLGQPLHEAEVVDQAMEEVQTEKETTQEMEAETCEEPMQVVVEEEIETNTQAEVDLEPEVLDGVQQSEEASSATDPSPSAEIAVVEDMPETVFVQDTSVVQEDQVAQPDAIPQETNADTSLPAIKPHQSPVRETLDDLVAESQQEPTKVVEDEDEKPLVATTNKCPHCKYKGRNLEKHLLKHKAKEEPVVAKIENVGMVETSTPRRVSSRRAAPKRPLSPPVSMIKKPRTRRRLNDAEQEENKSIVATEDTIDEAPVAKKSKAIVPIQIAPPPAKETKEVEPKVKCQLCSYEGRPYFLNRHMNRKHKTIEEEKPAKEESPTTELQLTQSGRRMRGAARKASKKVAEAINILKAKTEGDKSDIENDADSDDEDVFNLSKELDVRQHFVVSKKAGKREFKCKLCQEFVHESSVEMESHILATHANELSGDLEEEEDRESTADMFEEEEDYDLDTSEERKVRKSEPRKDRPAALDPHYELVRLEAKFREENFEKNSFEDFHTTRAQWQILSADVATSYYPNCDKSVPFNTRRVLAEPNLETPSPLDLFSSRVDSDESLSLFAGGPVWASAWCPLANRSKEEPRYLALSTHNKLDAESRFNERPECEPGLIQIWKVTPDLKEAKMVLGIAHNLGKIWCIRWCPSGNQAESSDPNHLSRLGLLAAACADGTVRLFSVCRPEQLSNQPVICSIAPVRTLRLSSGPCSWHCLQISWFRGEGHRVIAASFSDGSIALWDVTADEFSLQRDENDLYPYQQIVAHTSSATCLDLSDIPSHSNPSYPSLCVTGSSDRHVSVWDLDNPAKPTQSVKRGYVSDVKWLHHYPGQVIASFDDVFLQSHTQSVIFDFSAACNVGVRTFPIVSQNSAVWSSAYNPWANVVATSTAGGEMILFMAPPLGKAFEYDKETNRRRVYLFRTDVNEGGSVTFVDSALDNLKGLPMEELRLARQAESMKMEDISSSPVAALNRVSMNTDFDSIGLVFGGGQAGLGRIVNVTALVKTEKLNQEMRENRYLS